MCLEREREEEVQQHAIALNLSREDGDMMLLGRFSHGSFYGTVRKWPGVCRAVSWPLPTVGPQPVTPVLGGDQEAPGMMGSRMCMYR